MKIIHQKLYRWIVRSEAGFICNYWSDEKPAVGDQLILNADFDKKIVQVYQQDFANFIVMI